jgi:hypothetical protein
MPRIKERRPVTSVWSTYGHRFISNGDGVDEFGYSIESCLMCGAVYQLQHGVDGDWTRGLYCAANGDEPDQCTGNTGMAHGYSGERYCHEHQHPRDYSDHECSHVSHDCNCILCNS